MARPDMMSGEAIPSCRLSTRLARLACALLMTLCPGCHEASARLGQALASYKQEQGKELVPIDKKEGERSTYYMFAMRIDPRQARVSPGYAAGVTITVVDGKVVGQSLAIRPGNNASKGADLARVHAFAFAYEALGRPVPKNREKAQREFDSFCQAVSLALSGQPQRIRFRGYQGRITVCQEQSGNLIVAATSSTAGDDSP